MAALTDVQMILGSSHVGDPVARRQGERRNFEPVEKSRRTTLPLDPNLIGSTAVGRGQYPQKTFEPPKAKYLLPSEVTAISSPLQVWEGTVIEVNRVAGVMQVLLDAKIGQIPRHTGEIDLEWVDDQDQDLVRPGAVFYLTLFKRTKPSVENAQELRFRRRPSWTAAQLKQIEEDAAMLLSKMKALPTSA